MSIKVPHNVEPEVCFLDQCPLSWRITSGSTKSRSESPIVAAWFVDGDYSSVVRIVAAWFVDGNYSSVVSESWMCVDHVYRAVVVQIFEKVVTCV